MAFIRHTALAVNCGYARVCIHRNSNPERGTGSHARQSIDTTKRMTNFKEQFSSTYCFPEGYFDVKGKNKMTQFERDCNKILDSFGTKFLAGGDKESYLNTFSHSKWHKLSVAERKQHTLANCARCFELHKDSQHSFPLKPFYHHKPIITVDQDALRRQNIKKVTTSVLTELNCVYEVETSTSFTDAVVRNKSSGLEKKKDAKDKKKDKVKVSQISIDMTKHWARFARQLSQISIDMTKHWARFARQLYRKSQLT